MSKKILFLALLLFPMCVGYGQPKPSIDETVSVKESFNTMEKYLKDIKDFIKEKKDYETEYSAGIAENYFNKFGFKKKEEDIDSLIILIKEIENKIKKYCEYEKESCRDKKKILNNRYNEELKKNKEILGKIKEDLAERHKFIKFFVINKGSLLSLDARINIINALYDKVSLDVDSIKDVVERLKHKVDEFIK